MLKKIFHSAIGYILNKSNILENEKKERNFITNLTDFKILSNNIPKRNIVIIYRPKNLDHYLGSSKNILNEYYMNKDKYNYELYYLTFSKELFHELNKNSLPVLYFPKNSKNEYLDVNIIKKLLQAKLIIYEYDCCEIEGDEIVNALISGAKKIFIGHGHAEGYVDRYKELTYGDFYKKKILITRLINRLNFDYVIAQKFRFNKFIENYEKQNFVFKKKISITDNPRCSTILKNNDKLDFINVDNNAINLIKKNYNKKKLILFCPSTSLKTHNIFLKFEDSIDKINFEDFDKFLDDNNLIFFISLGQNERNHNCIKNYKNIFFLKAKTDVYPLLNSFDVLITDYSTISIDFGKLNKINILFFENKNIDIILNNFKTFFSEWYIKYIKSFYVAENYNELKILLSRINSLKTFKNKEIKKITLSTNGAEEVLYEIKNILSI